jgi:hypothetical protein
MNNDINEMYASGIGDSPDYLKVGAFQKPENQWEQIQQNSENIPCIGGDHTSQDGTKSIQPQARSLEVASKVNGQWSIFGIFGGEEYSGFDSASLSLDGTVTAFSVLRFSSPQNHLLKIIGTQTQTLFTYVDGFPVPDTFPTVYYPTYYNKKTAINKDGTKFCVAGNMALTQLLKVRVFQKAGSTYLFLGQEISITSSGFIRSIFMNEDGTRIAVTVGPAPGTGTSIYSTEVYQYNGTAWNLMGSVFQSDTLFYNASSTASNSHVGGRTFSIDGNTVAIRKKNGDQYRGVQFYRWNGTNWNAMGAQFTGGIGNYNFGARVHFNNSGTKVALCRGKGGTDLKVQIYKYIS